MDASRSGPRRSPRLIEQAEHHELEHPEDKRNRLEKDRNIYQRIRNTFASENDRSLMLEQRCIRERERKNALTEEEIQRDRERRRIAYHKRRHQTGKGEINDTKRQASTTAHAPSATSTSQSDRVPSVGSIYSSIKKSCESLTRIASALECHQASSSRPHKSPRLNDQAQRQELIEAETEKGNDRESKLEQRRVRAREKRSALTEQEIERDLERRRNVYQRRRQQKVVGIEGNLPTRFSNLRQSPSFLNRDKMDEPGPSTTGASTATTFTSQATFIPREAREFRAS